MALDARKRQKKAERRNAKVTAKRKALARQKAVPRSATLERATRAPILHCCTTEALHDQGMGYVLIARELSNIKVAFALFLVDAYCLGVKDVIWDVAARGDYDAKLFRKLFGASSRIDVEPVYARKFVEGAVEYARGIGFSPPAEYSKARLIFGDIDASTCQESIEYGQDGKPHFIAGPHDSYLRCREIVSTLTRTCGPDGFHFTMPVPNLEDAFPSDAGRMPVGVRPRFLSMHGSRDDD